MLQQEKKTDYNAVIGFALIGILLFWYLNNETKFAQSQIQNNAELVESTSTNATEVSDASMDPVNKANSVLVSQDLQEAYGAFANAAAVQDQSAKYYLENDLLKVEIAAKGARVTSAYLKEY